jgi:hypothetical protein
MDQFKPSIEIVVNGNGYVDVGYVVRDRTVTEKLNDKPIKKKRQVSRVPKDIILFRPKIITSWGSHLGHLGYSIRNGPTPFCMFQYATDEGTDRLLFISDKDWVLRYPVNVDKWIETLGSYEPLDHWHPDAAACGTVKPFEDRSKEIMNWKNQKEFCEKARVAIVFVAYGFVLVGVIQDDGRETGEMLLQNARIITRWGTDGVGIGALCHQGMLKETLLHRVEPYKSPVIINRDNVLFVLPCNPEVWYRPLTIDLDEIRLKDL